ncbi:MAG: hypothetical protein IPP74_12360 [Alphaproteobacteria bacterium]|nr:hypothetical protein [Alphaproteobacteria bacterium]
MNKKYRLVTLVLHLQPPHKTLPYSARALKPYSPRTYSSKSATSYNGDLIISWKRRTRIGGDWRDGVDIPLEESERYEVDIMLGNAIKRTFLVLFHLPQLTLPSNKIRDFGQIQNNVTVNVQLSSTVGRGYAGYASL